MPTLLAAQTTARRRIASVAAAFGALLAAAPVASAATLYVPAQHPTLASAYAAARPGDTIELAAGMHRDQEIGRGSKPVTFRGVPGAKVRSLDNSASNVTFDGIEVDAGFAQTAGFENHGADNVTFKNAAIGNVTDEKGAVVNGANFTFDNVLFHDAVYRTDGTHMECVYALSVPGFTLRNSTFRDCAVMDIFFTYGDWWSPLPPAYGNITIENNVFGHPEMENNAGWHYYGLYVANNGPNGHRVLDGWTVRNNTFETAVELPDTASGDTRWVGNIGTWDCTRGVTFRHNVGKRCGPTDKALNPAASNRTTTAAVGWVDPAAGDFRLRPNSPAIGAADPQDAPALDRNGSARDARPDAGALEYGAGPPAAPAPEAQRIVLSARLGRATICRRARRGCPRIAKLRLRTTAPARVAVRVLRLRAGRAPALRRAFGVRIRAARSVPLRARKLRPGRYRIVALVRDDAGGVTARQAVRLRVRR